jgi:GNAT superfamily N-acetyltransferase
VSHQSANTAPPLIVVPLQDGTPVGIRRIVPEDAEILRAGIAALSPEARRARFFSPGAALPDSVLRRLTDGNPACHLGWGAILPEEAETPAIGAAHILRSAPHSPDGELALALDDAWHGMGIARLLLAAVMADAATRGVRHLSLVTLADNRRAIALFTALGAEHRGYADGTASFALSPGDALAALRGRDPARRHAAVIRAVAAQASAADSRPALRIVGQEAA